MEHSDKLSIIRSNARRLKLSWIGANVAETLVRAQSASPSYDNFLIDLMQSEVASREAHQKILRYKWRFRSKGTQKSDDYFGVKPPKKSSNINKKGRKIGSRVSIFRSIATQLS